MIISGFPGIGKTTLARLLPDQWVDLDSSSFSWESPGVRHREWPVNYVTQILKLDRDGKNVLCSSHDNVRDLLRRVRTFVLVYPGFELKDEYLARIRERDGDDTLANFVEKAWIPMQETCMAQRGARHFVLGAGQHLGDIMDEIEETLFTPGRWRKKPVVIEAVQWAGGAKTATPIINWILGEEGTARYHDETTRKRPTQDDVEAVEVVPEHIAIDTLEGTHRASPDDWIIRGVQGEFYPCKPDIFAGTYERAS